MIMTITSVDRIAEGLLQGVPGRVERELSSALSFARPILILLEELQTIGDVVRVDALLRLPSGREELISSATRSERELLDRVTFLSDEVCRENENVCQSIYRVALKGSIDGIGRLDLLCIQRKIFFSFVNGITLGDELLLQIELFGRNDSPLLCLVGTDNEPDYLFKIIRECGARVRNFASDTHNMSAGGQSEFEDLNESERAKAFILSSLATFDSWLRRLLKGSELSEQEIANPFLAQYFWLVDAAESLPALVPLFLSAQRDVLSQVVDEMAKKEVLEVGGELLDNAAALEFADTYRLTSAFSFTGYVAETMLSVYVEDWPSQPLIMAPPNLSGRERDGRRLFSELMSNCHRRYRKFLPNGVDDFEVLPAASILYTIPAAVFGSTLFVVQVNLPHRLAAPTRLLIGARIRELSGLMVYQAQFQRELRVREAELDKELKIEQTKSQLFPEAIVRDVAHTLLQSLPMALSVFKEALEQHQPVLTIGRDDVVDAFDALEKGKAYLEKVREQSEGGFGRKETVDARAIVHRAIENIPKNRLGSLRITFREPTVSVPIITEGFTLDAAVQNLVINAAEATGLKGNLAIDIKTDIEGPILTSRRGVLIEFHDNGPGVPIDPVESAKLWNLRVSGKPGGSGWGLPLVRYFVKHLNGHVEFDATVTQGAKIKIWLPTVKGASNVS